MAQYSDRSHGRSRQPSLTVQTATIGTGREVTYRHTGRNAGTRGDLHAPQKHHFQPFPVDRTRHPGRLPAAPGHGPFRPEPAGNTATRDDRVLRSDAVRHAAPPFTSLEP